MSYQSHVSVIVICRNEVNYLERCLDAILNQHAPGLQTEILVVDGMSSDGSAELIQTKYLHKVTLLTNIGLYTPQAINLGIQEATGEFIVIAGARSVMSPDYLSRSIEVLQADKATWCTGGRIIHTGEDPVSKGIAAAMSSIAGVGLLNFRTMTKTRYVDTVSTPVFRKNLVDIIGPFDESCIRNQDDDFSYRMIQAGGKILLNGSIYSSYYVRKSFRNLSQQYFQYAFWKIFVNRKHQTITSVRQVFPALLLLTLAISVWLSWKLTGVILLVYLLAILTASVLTAIRHSCGVIPVALSIISMHFSYGAGYLYGIWKLILFNKPVPEGLKNLTR